MTEETCGSCRYYRTEGKKLCSPGPRNGEEVGRCRRYPPLAYHEGQALAVWPTVSSAEWCGEHEGNPK
jgi:hypothetical protein